MNGPRVSVIVTTRGAPRTLRSLLEAIRGPAPVEQCEVVIVLDGAGPQAAADVRRWGERASLPTRVIEQPRTGVGAARNRGVDAARGEVVLFLDDDLLPAAELVEQHLSHHDRDVVVVGDVHLAEPPRGRPARRTGWRQHVVEWARRNDVTARRSSPGHALGHRDLHASNLSLRRTRFTSLGGFDEGFGDHGGDDRDFAERTLRSGCPVVIEPRAVATQARARASSDDPPSAFDEGWADVRLAQKHPQLVTELRLARLPRGIVGWWFAGRAFEAPAVARLGQMLLVGLTGLADRLGFHGVWRRSRRAAALVAYWLGVASATGSRRSWEAIRRLGAPHPAIDLDLNAAVPAHVDVRSAVPCHVVVHHGDRQLARVEIPAGVATDRHALAHWIARSVGPRAIIEAAGTQQLRALTLGGLDETERPG